MPRRCAGLWTVALLLTAGSIGCDNDNVDPQSPPIELRILAGDGQIGRVGEVVADPLVVGVTDRSGTPVPGVVVFWEAQGGGSVDPDSVSTDSDGHAVTFRLLGPDVGDHTTTAAVSEGVPDVSPVTFTTTALAED